MTRLLAPIAVPFILASSLSVAQARQTGSARSHQHSRMVQATFRLQVKGNPSGHTFWVAYGPLNDQFGLIQLRPSSRGLYTATHSLPADGRTIFAFLAGSGTISTHFGAAPGDPVLTIKRIGPVSMASWKSPTIVWRASASA